MFHKLEHEAEELVHEVEGKFEHEAEEIREEVVKVLHSATHLFQHSSGDEPMHNIKESLNEDPEGGSPQKHCLVDSVWFNSAIIVLTVCCTLQMGLEVDYPDWTTTWLICENVFTAGFAFEMVAKLCVYKWHYFTDSANWLDGFLSCLGILDCWIFEFFEFPVDLQSLSVLRIMRLMRLARVLKLMRSVKPLVLVITGVMKAMSTAMYVFGLCSLVIYVFAIFLTTQFKHNTDLYPGYSAEVDIIDEQEFMANYNPYICFGSMLSSMLTLFNIAVLAEWGEIVRPIFVKQPLYLVIFLFFVTCVGFGVMNVLIAAIVDVVTAESRKIETDYRIQLKKEKLEILDKIQSVLEDIDKNKDDVMTADELRLAMQESEPLKQLMSQVHLPRGWSADELLDMLDNDGDGQLQYNEFCTSLFRLLDSDEFHQICIMQASVNQVKHLLKQQNRYYSALEDDIASIKAALEIAPSHQLSQDKFNYQKSSDTALPSLPPDNDKQQQSSIACNEGCDYSSTAKSAEHSNTFRGITKEELVGSTHDLFFKPQEGELISRTQLKGILSSALLVMKECVHEEFAAAVKGLESELRCLGAEREVFDSQEGSSLLEAAMMQSPCPAEHWRPLDTPAGPRPTAEHTDRLSKSSDSINKVEPLRAQFEPDLEPGRSAKVAHVDLPEGLMHEAVHPQYFAHDFIFDESTQRLGFEVQWVKDGLPIVASVVPDGAANMRGILQGDQIAECNGMSTVGKDRKEVLQSLGMRPMVLSILRS